MGHLWSPKLIFDAKSEPTAPPKCPQGPKHASKMIPKGPKMILKVTLKVYSLGTLTLDRRFEQRPGGLREALTIIFSEMLQKCSHINSELFWGMGRVILPILGYRGVGYNLRKSHSLI